MAHTSDLPGLYMAVQGEEAGVAGPSALGACATAGQQLD